MKKLPLIVIPALATAAVLTGCQSHHLIHKPVTPQTKAYENQAKSIVSACVGKSAGNIKSIETCLAPGGAAAKVKFETCAIKSLSSPLVLVNKAKVEAALAQCIEHDR